MDQGASFLTIEAEAERFIHAWFPSYRQIGQRMAFNKFVSFFRAYNRFHNLGKDSTRRIFDDKLLFSAFLTGIGISTPASRWIGAKDVAFSPEGHRISTCALVSLLSTGRWFVKPRSGNGGHGTFLLNHGAVTKADGGTVPKDQIDLLKLLKAYESFLVQEVIVQSDDYAVFSPSSLNTVRCLTYLNRTGEAAVAAASLRMGNGHSIVDNASSGGIYCGIDLSTHRLIGPGLADVGGVGNKVFEKHPASNVILPGYKVTYLNDVFAICKSAHEALRGPLTIGWDAAMTDAGPCILEGNARWSATLHSLVDPGVKQRLWTLFLRDHQLSGTGFPGKLPHLSKNSLATVVFRVKGKVQGVGFRKWTGKLAVEKGLLGRARNLGNGDVEVRLTGPLRLLEFAILATMDGPRKAEVREIEILSLVPVTRD
jgi:acylphosphatase